MAGWLEALPLITGKKSFLRLVPQAPPDRTKNRDYLAKGLQAPWWKVGTLETG